VNNGERITRRRVSSNGQSEAVEGRIMICNGAGRDNKYDRDKYDACGINVDGTVISDVSPETQNISLYVLNKNAARYP